MASVEIGHLAAGWENLTGPAGGPGNFRVRPPSFLPPAGPAAPFRAAFGVTGFAWHQKRSAGVAAGGSAGQGNLTNSRAAAGRGAELARAAAAGGGAERARAATASFPALDRFWR